MNTGDIDHELVSAVLEKWQIDQALKGPGCSPHC